MRVSSATATSRSAAASRAGAEVLALLMTAYVALLPYQIQVTKEIRFAPADCFLLLALVLAPARLKYYQRAWSVWHWALPPLFILGSLMTALNSGQLSRYAVLNKTVGLLLLCLMYLAVTSVIDDWQSLRRLLRVFVLSVVLQNIVGIVAFLAAYSSGMETPWTSQGGRRLSGLLIDPNAYGGLLVLTVALIEGTSIGRAPLLRGWLLTLSRLTLASGILLTFSRTAWASLGLVLVGLWTLHPRTVAPAVAAGLAAALMFGSAASDSFVSFVVDMAARPEQVRGRFELVEIAWAQFTRNPLLGAGLNSFWDTEGTIVHNTPLWFLADFGIVGFSVFAGFVGWFLAKGRLTYRLAPITERPVVVGLILSHIAMLGLAMGIEAFYQRHWWLVMGFIGASYSLVLRAQPAALESGHTESDGQTGLFQSAPKAPVWGPSHVPSSSGLMIENHASGRRSAAVLAPAAWNENAEGVNP